MFVSVIRRGCRWGEVNIKFFILKILATVIKHAPYNIFLVRVLGCFFGLMAMCLRWREWNAIIGFARHTGSTLSAPMYVMKYFFQKGIDQAWEIMFYEAEPMLQKYITIENQELLERAIRDGKGVILLGAHYGPALYMFVLGRINDKVRALVNIGPLTYWKDTVELGLKPVKSNMLLYLSSPRRSLVAGRSEKELLTHLRKGGVILMHIDLPGPRKAARKVNFLDLPISPHYFPFKLALKYHAPVFFCFFDRTYSGGYLLRIVSSGEFMSPDEGFERYVSLMQNQIRAYPFMWGFLPHFLEWSSRDYSLSHLSKMSD